MLPLSTYGLSPWCLLFKKCIIKHILREYFLPAPPLSLSHSLFFFFSLHMFPELLEDYSIIAFMHCFSSQLCSWVRVLLPSNIRYNSLLRKWYSCTSDSLRNGRSEDRIPGEGEFFCARPDRPRSHSASGKRGTCCFPEVKWPRHYYNLPLQASNLRMGWSYTSGTALCLDRHVVEWRVHHFH